MQVIKPNCQECLHEDVCKLRSDINSLIESIKDESKDYSIGTKSGGMVKEKFIIECGHFFEKGSFSRIRDVVYHDIVLNNEEIV